MNIVQAFIKFNGKLIIIISGLSGSGKTSIAKFIERDFKLKLINIDNHIINDFDKIVTLPNDIKMTNWDDIDSYDWVKINDEVIANQTNGVVICGPYFPTEKLKFDADFHIQIKISKQTLIEKRIKYAESNKEKFKDLETNSDINLSVIPTIVNQITYPSFLKYSEESKIDKYVNSKDLTIDQIYDQIADYLFFKINENLQEKNKTSQQIKKHNYYRYDDSENLDDSDDLKFDPNNFDSSTSSDNYSDKSIKLRSPEPEPIFVGSDDDAEVDYWEYPKVGGKFFTK